jgi:glycosyltransferase involved in cell wall biosynthesis
MADFFASFRKRKGNVHLLWLTTGSHDKVRELMTSRGIGSGDFSVLSVASAAVPSYLAAADAGLAFAKSGMSRVARSPTKNGEYLACGLPLIINAGVGDSDALINDWKAGVLIEEFSEAQYEEAGRAIEAMTARPDVRERTRAVAEQLFDLNVIGGERYASLYERVLRQD